MTSFNTAPGTEGSVPAATGDRTQTSATSAPVPSNTALSQGTQAPTATPTTNHGPVASVGNAAPAAAALPPAPVPAPASAGLRTQGPWVAGSLFVVIPPQHLQAIPEAIANDDDPPLWYCITRGKYVGVTLSNPLALGAVVGVSGSRMKSYKTQLLALQAFNEMLDYHMVGVVAW
ncbi:hypothetical protein C8R45DRAFT_948048 [Mycena sanguinolenta]|nr:hypothetical protein C8R45DRAFT_948048 [Mycena sanguinolenta]